MSWIQKFPWLSFSILLLAYGVFGWLTAQGSIFWSEWIIRQGRAWGLIIDDEYALFIIDLLGVALILAIAIALTAPVALVTVFFGIWVRSQIKAWVSVLAWAFAIVFIIRWINYFAKFLVLLCAALLCRLDLQASGYNDWQTFLILTLICLGGFGGGVLAFMQLN